MSWTRLLELLPSIATQPLAVVAYIVLVSGWVLLQFRRRRSADFLKALEALDEKHRPAFCRQAGYAYDDLARLSRKDQVRLITRRYVLLAFLAALVAIVLLVLGTRRAIVNAADIQRQVEESTVKIKRQVEASAGDINRRIDQVLRKVEEITPVRRELSVQLDEQQRREFTVSVASLAGEMSGSEDSKVQRYADRLNELMEALPERLPPKLPDVATARIRFAQATLWYARYRRAVRRTGEKEPFREELREQAGGLDQLSKAFLAASAIDEAAECAILAGNMYRALGDHKSAIDRYEQAESLARQRNSAPVLMHALEGKVLTNLYVACDAKLAQTDASELLAVAERLGDKLQLLRAVILACGAKQELHEWPAALVLADRAVELLPETADREWEFYALVDRSSVFYELSKACDEYPVHDFCEKMAAAAVEDARRAHSIAVDAGWEFLAEQCDTLIWTRTLRGELVRSQRTVDRATALIPGSAKPKEVPPDLKRLVDKYRD